MISNEFLKGSLSTIILKIFKEEGPMHGYLLSQKVYALTGGQIRITYGSLYPLLHKLKKDKVLVTVRDITTGRMRIHYSLTPKGHSLADKKIKELREFIETLKKIIELKAEKK